MVNPSGESFQIEEDSGKFNDVSLKSSTERLTDRSRLRGFSVDRRVWIVAVGVVGVLAVVGIAVGASTGSSASSSSSQEEVIHSKDSQKVYNAHVSESLSKLAQAIHSIRDEKEKEEEEIKMEEIKEMIKRRNEKNIMNEENKAQLEVELKNTKTQLENAKMTKFSKPRRPTSTKYSSKLPMKRVNERMICSTPECAESANFIQQSLNMSVDPCVDFYEFACGGWISQNAIPDTSVGTFYAADDLLQSRLELILNSDADPSEPISLFKIRMYYDTCMDLDTLNSDGLGELTYQLGRQGGWPMTDNNFDENKYVLESSMVGIQKWRVSPFVAVGNDADFKNTSNKILYVTEGILGLSSTLLLNSGLHPLKINAYKDYIIGSAKLVRNSLSSTVTDADIVVDTENMVNFEIELAQVMASIVIDDDLSENLDLMTIAELQTLTDSITPDQFLWLNYFKTLFADSGGVTITADEPVYVIIGNFMPELAKLLGNTDTRTVANYLGWWWTMVTGPETTNAMRDLHNTFNEAVYGATPRSRTKHCVDQTNYNFGFATSRAYVDDFFPLGAKDENVQLVELIVSAFNVIINDVTWMAEEDKTKSVDKLLAIKKFVAYPDWIEDDVELDAAYEGMAVVAGDHYGNIINLADFIRFNDLSTFRNSPELAFTAMPPTVVNAYYSPFSNSINILVGILQSPFYSHNTLEALNFGGIGMVVGHELTHGFDNNGRRFDLDGNYNTWWSQESIDNFNDASSCFVDQYNEFSPPELIGSEYEGEKVFGNQTLGENIADNGGIHEAFLAYRNRIATIGEEPMLPGLDEFSPDQLFFLSFANLWCEAKTDESYHNQILYDPHSPGRFRVVGTVSNDVDFANAFQCAEGTPMNRGDDRCVLW